MKGWIQITACAAILCGCGRQTQTPPAESVFPSAPELAAHPPLSLASAQEHSLKQFPQMEFKRQDAGEVGQLQYGSLLTNGINIVVNFYEDDDPSEPIRAAKLYLTHKGSPKSAETCVAEIVQPFAIGLYDNGAAIWEALQAVEPYAAGVQHLNIETHGVSITVFPSNTNWQSISYDLISLAEQAAMQKRYFDK